MMSVVVRDQIDGKVYVLAKGAESQIIERLTSQSKASSLKARVEKEVSRLGSIGLRTLCFAMRELSEEELNQTDWRNSDKSLLSSLCEKDLNLVGCTGV